MFQVPGILQYNVKFHIPLLVVQLYAHFQVNTGNPALILKSITLISKCRYVIINFSFQRGENMKSQIYYAFRV